MDNGQHERRISASARETPGQIYKSSLLPQYFLSDGAFNIGLCCKSKRWQRAGLIGALEERVMLTLVRLGGESYAVPIAAELKNLTGKEVSPATVYMVLRRLESAGYLTSWVGTPAPERGGRPRRFFSVVSDQVLPLLRASRRDMLALWSGIEPTLDET